MSPNGHDQASSYRPRISPVRDRATFERLSTQGRRVRRHPVSVAWVPDDHRGQGGAEGVRVAYAITRKVGSAVVRNRVRRRLRAVNQELAPSLRPGAYLMTAQSDAATIPYERLRESVREALDALAQGNAESSRSGR